MNSNTGFRGRGAGENLHNRFLRFSIERDSEWNEEDPAPATEFLYDNTKGLLSHNDSPDIPFDYGLNPYRGCEHGCIYCYARPGHEYLGFSAGLDFETRIVVKKDAPALLRQELQRPGWKPQTISISGVTDAYQPIERKLKITRRCLETLADFRNPVAIVTKNHLVTRDIDILKELAAFGACAVMVTVTSLDPKLCATLEPRTSRPARRLDAIEALAAAGIPTGVMVAPIIPAITDHESPAILKAAAERGARYAAWVNLRLPLAVAPLFGEWLERHYPDRKDKVLNRVREMSDGKLNRPEFRERMRGSGVYADFYAQQFKIHAERNGLNKERLELSTAAFRRVKEGQPSLW